MVALEKHRVPHSKGREDHIDGRALTVQLDGFALDEIVREAKRQGVSVEELARFALMYYLADLDRGRISQRVPPPTSAGGPASG